MKRFKKFLRGILQDALEAFYYTPKKNIKENWEMAIPTGTLAMLVFLRIAGWLPEPYRTFKSISYIMIFSMMFAMCVLLIRFCRLWREHQRLLSTLNKDANSRSFLKNLSPESIGELIQFFLPQTIRRECFEPYFEELKEDRLRAEAVAKTRLSKAVVEIGFLFRLLIAFLQSLICWFRKVFPLGEIVRSFFKTGGQ